MRGVVARNLWDCDRGPPQAAPVIILKTQNPHESLDVTPNSQHYLSSTIGQVRSTRDCQKVLMTLQGEEALSDIV